MNKPVWAFCNGCDDIRTCKRIRHLITGHRGVYCGGCRKSALRAIREAKQRQMLHHRGQ